MISVMSLFTVAALVSIQCSFTSAQLDNSKMDLDNSLQPNAPPARHPPRVFVNIPRPPPATASRAPGETLELTCNAFGKPAPSIRWLKNGRPVDYELESNELLPEEPSSYASCTSTLVITDSTNSEDVYTCLATAGDVQKSTTTTVYSTPASEADELLSLQKLFKLPSRPRIVMSYETLMQNLGTSAVLPCQTSSADKSQLYWTDNNGNLVYGNSRMQVLPSGELVIASLRWSDMGEFSCSVKNMLGKDTATTFVYPLKIKSH